MPTPETPNLVRLFIAVPVDAAILAQLEQRQQQLRRRLPPSAIRWVQPEHIHLTLRFLGNVPPNAISSLEAAVRDAAAPIAPLRLAVERLGCFPNATHPKVIWAGLAGDWEPLRQLQAAVEQHTAGWGEPPEPRAFAPHLTLGRVKTVRREELLCIGKALQQAASLDLGGWTAQDLCLMQSRLSREGPTYTILARLPLGGSTPSVE